jgi:WD40 repeat protein
MCSGKSAFLVILEYSCVDSIRIQRTISSQGGSIWSIAANPSSTLLALGCEDGTVRLLSLIHDTLTHHRRFDRVKCRILSIAWAPPLPREITKATNQINSDESSDDDDDEDDWSDAWLVTGGSDSSLRKWDISTGRVIDRMGTDKMRGERTLVWTVGVLGLVFSSSESNILISQFLEMGLSCQETLLEWSSSGIHELALSCKASKVMGQTSFA